MRRLWAFIVGLSRLGGTAVSVPDAEGIEWTAPVNRDHWTAPPNRVHYTAESGP